MASVMFLAYNGFIRIAAEVNWPSAPLKIAAASLSRSLISGARPPSRLVASSTSSGKAKP